MYSEESMLAYNFYIDLHSRKVDRFNQLLGMNR